MSGEQALGVFRTHPDTKMPTRATNRAQCIDLYAAEPATIYPGQTVLIDLGVKVVIPEGYGLEFRERSGLATKGIIIGAGVIDEDYHGPLKAVVRYMRAHSLSQDDLDSPFMVSVGDKIVQAELVQRVPIKFCEIDAATLQAAVDDSVRGERGFGSTG